MAGWRRGRVGVLVVLVVLVVLLSGPLGARAQQAPARHDAAAEGEIRTWTDLSGKFSREAEFLKLEDGLVHLRMKGGKETKIPLKELSKKDRDWVRARGAAAGPAKPVGSRIVIRSYKAIVDDSVILADVLKQQALAGAVPGLFVALTGGKPLEGFDIARPIVITVHVDAKGQPAGTLVAVPVQGKEKFQKTLENVFPGKMTPKGRSHEIPMLGRGVFTKPGERYFLLSDDADIVRGAAADPEPPVVVSDVAAESFYGAVGEDARNAGLAQFEAMMAAIPVAPGASEDQRNAQRVTNEWVKKTVRSIATEGDRSTFEMSIDPTTRQVSFAMGIRARSGTDLARAFASYGGLKPRFVAGGGDQAIGWVGISMPSGEWMRMMLETVLGGGLAGMNAAAARAGAPSDSAKEVIADVERETRKLMASEYLEQEYLFGLEGTETPRLVMRFGSAGIGGFFTAITKMVAIDSAVAATPDGDGILSIPVPAAGAASMGPFGATPVRMASSAESMVIGFNCADTGPLKAILAAPPAASDPPPISARIDLAKLWPVMAKANAATAALSDVVGQSGNLRADVSGLSDGIELRVNADDGVLRLLGALGAMAAQAQGAAGAPGFPGAPPGFPGPGGPPAGILPPSIQGFPVPPVAPPQAPAP